MFDKDRVDNADERLFGTEVSPRELADAIYKVGLKVSLTVGLTKQLAENVGLALEGVMTKFAENVQPFVPYIENYFKALEELPEKERKALKTLAENGWYADGEWLDSMDVHLANELEAGKREDVDTSLCRYYEENLDIIRERLCIQFPKRAALLGPAFDAHKREEYALSIPVLLSQADGICADLFHGRQLYSEKRQVEFKHLLEQCDINVLLKPTLFPLTISVPINYTKKKRSEGFRELNRHAVLHGEDTDYATETNGCKAISHLCGVAYALTELQQETKGKSSPDNRTEKS